MATDEVLTFERREGKSPEVLIFTVTGPITLRTMFGLQAELRGTASPALTILDLTGVPYLDSAGIGVVINQFVHCQKNKRKLVVAGVNSRALELFKLTKVNTLIPMFATVDEAESSS
jgi:anti-sigma B factor antagonist